MKWYYQSKKKDEKEFKAKHLGESSEATKEVVTSSSVPENEKSSKRSVPLEKAEENGKADKSETEDTEDKVKLTEQGEEGPSSKKFKRLSE